MANEIDHIAELEKKLYARDPENIPKRKFGILHPLKDETVSTWGATKLPPRVPQTTSIAGYKRFFIFAFIFFVVALGIALFSFFRGAQTLSSKNVDVAILGNSFVAGGEELPIQVAIANKNSADLVNVTLTLNYPKGATDAQGSDVAHLNRDIGTIVSGKTHSESFSVVLYGEQGINRSITATLAYQLAGSTATFQKSATFSTLISSSPLELSVDAPSAVVPNQPFTLTIHNRFAGDKLLNNVVTRIEYPNGFVFEKAIPAPAYGNNVWSLGDLEKGAEQTITITGRLLGEVADQKAFRIYVGTPEGDISSRIAVAYNSILTTLTLAQPFISTLSTLNGQQGDRIVVLAGSKIRGSLKWQNNTPLTVAHAVVELKLSGDAVDYESMNAPKSYYDSTEHIVTWNDSSDPTLASIAAGEGGEFVFEFATTSTTSPHDVTLSVSLKGDFPDRDNKQESIQNAVVQTIAFASNVNFTATSAYSLGPIKNTGPYPPKAESETTYTITWAFRPVENPLANIVATATLPSDITWAGVIIPQSENIAYNPGSRLITWNVAALPKMGPTAKVRSISFQVKSRPTKAAVGSVPTLLGETTVSALDTSTNTEVTATAPVVRTTLTGDPIYTFGKEAVVP